MQHLMGIYFNETTRKRKGGGAQLSKYLATEKMLVLATHTKNNSRDKSLES